MSSWFAARAYLEMITLFRTLSYRLFSNRCQLRNYIVVVEPKLLLQHTFSGCRSILCVRACQTSARFVTRVFLTDDDEFERYRISSQLLDKDKQIIIKLKSELGPGINLSVLPAKQVVVMGSNVESVNYATERVLQEIHAIRDGQEKIYKETVVTDEDVAVHKEICGRMIGKRGLKMETFVASTGLDFDITPAKKNYIYVSGVDVDAVKKAAILVEQRIDSIRKFAGIT